MTGQPVGPARTGVGADVRNASTGDVSDVAAALARAFFDDPVFRWSVPDDDRRGRMLPAFFSLFTETLIVYDEVYTDRSLTCGALWVPPGEKPTPDEVADDFGARMEAIAGVDAERLFEVSKLVDEHHPPGSYYFLQFMGVEPAGQGRGLGSALMRPILDRCDREREWAYLDATSDRNKRLYERHGFEAEGEYSPEGGPPLFPMWREPNSGG